MTISERPPAHTQPRVIRVFVSSTFRDMHAEREELIKRVFPQLRKLCEERGVTWGEVDLRWGITDEQAAEGQVLPICLEEIHRCRPYFIGLLGERYGWVPDEIPAELIEQQPWLAEHQGHSITELEILHGALNDPEMAEHAYFYLRDPVYVDTLPAREQAAYREGLTVEDVEAFGRDEAQRRAEECGQKLAALKERIRASGLPVRKDYRDPVDLGELVLRDLTALIDRLYPKGERPDPLDRETAEHEAFAASRAGVYIGRQAYFDRLDAHTEDDGPPLVVLGESGSGKSALLANWALRYRGAHPDDLVLMHFIGASPHSADWAAMVRRAMGEFKRRFDIHAEIPDQPDELRAAFANWLHRAAATERVVLVLDALNQLEDREGAPDLVWLPPAIPANVRLVLSTLPGRPLEELEERGWPTLQVEPLEHDECKRLIVEYLAQYTKALSPDRVERIARAPQAANPLYLRALLEELRVFGIHRMLDRRIDHYLAAGSVPELYEKVLERYEQDYERERPGLVGEAMALLWAARRGLSEAELLELLGMDGEPLPGAYWSPLHLAAEQSLVSRAGLIGFFHDYLRQAVRNRYLASEQEQLSVHLRLADYFAAQELGTRKINELPWQLAQAHAWRRLYELLADLPFFEAAWQADEFDVKAHWAQIERHLPLRLSEAYRVVLEAPASNHAYVMYLTSLLHSAGYVQEARLLREYLVWHARQVGDPGYLAESLGNLAQVLLAQGDADSALAHVQEQKRICRELDDQQGLAIALGNEAIILWQRGELDQALALVREKELLCQRLGDRKMEAQSLSIKATILQDRGQPDAATKLHQQHERICRELGDREGVAISLGNRANILVTRGDLHRAMALFQQQGTIFHELGNKEGIARCLGYQADILYRRGEWDRALTLHREAEQIVRELGHQELLAYCLGNQAVILAKQGDLDGAMALHKEEEHICRELGDKIGLGRSLGNQATILTERGDLDGAMALHKEEERICREVGDRNALQAALGNQALVLEARGNLEGAMLLHQQKARICRELDNRRGLAIALGNQARILAARGDLDGAMARHEEEERICRALDYRDGLQRSLGNQALVLVARDDLKEAQAPLQEKERICQEMGDLDGTASAVYVQAEILRKLGCLDEALDRYGAAERIYRELGGQQGLQQALGNQANILHIQGNHRRAAERHDEEIRLCRELDDQDALRTALNNQAMVLTALGDRTGALALHQEGERICRALGNRHGTATALYNQAVILHESGRPDEAMPLYQEAEHTFRDLGDCEGLHRTLGNKANILYQRGQWRQALEFHREKERICTELGDRQGAANALYSQAVVLQGKGDVVGAMDLYRKAERLYCEVDDRAGLQRLLSQRASILYAQGDEDAALALCEEQARLCRQLGDHESLQAVLGRQAEVLADMGDLHGALAFHQEKERLCKELGNRRGQAAALNNQGMLHYRLGHADQAMKRFEMAETVVRDLGDHELLAACLLNWAIVCESISRLDQAQSLAMEAYHLAGIYGTLGLAQRIRSFLDELR